MNDFYKHSIIFISIWVAYSLAILITVLLGVANAQYIQLNSQGYYIGETARNWAGAIEAEKPIVPKGSRAKWVDDNWLIVSEEIEHMGDYDFVEREFKDMSRPIKECSDRDEEDCKIVGYESRVQLVPQLNQGKRQARIAQDTQREAQRIAKETYEKRRRQAEIDLQEALIKGDGEQFRSRQEIREIIDNREVINELRDRIEVLENQLKGNR